MCLCAGLTDADLLGVEGLAAVVGGTGEVGGGGVECTGSRAPQDQGELAQHT